MFSFEGLYYAVGTIITSVVLGVLFSVAVDPLLVLLTVAIPALLYRQIAKVSIIERLRQ